MKKILLLTFAAMLAVSCGGSKKANESATVQERVTILCVNDFAELVQGNKMRVIDVRTRSEYNEAHIAGAENIDVNQPDFVERVNGVGSVAVYCRTGKRSQRAALMLAETGLEVYDLGGGIQAWQQAGKSTVSGLR